MEKFHNSANIIWKKLTLMGGVCTNLSSFRILGQSSFTAWKIKIKLIYLAISTQIIQLNTMCKFLVILEILAVLRMNQWPKRFRTYQSSRKKSQRGQLLAMSASPVGAVLANLHKFQRFGKSCSFQISKWTKFNTLLRTNSCFKTIHNQSHTMK